MPLYHDKWKNFLNENYGPVLTEDQLLAEGRLEDTKEKYAELDKRGVVDDLAGADPSGNNAYLGWMAKRLNDYYKEFQQYQGRQDFTERVKQSAKQFHQNKQRLEKKDIYQYKTVKELLDAIGALGQTRSQKRKFEKESAMEGSEIIHEDENFFAIRPFTATASCHYGRNSKWCISARGNNYFDSYTSDGKGFVMVRLNHMPEDSDKREWALVYDQGGELESVFDIEDTETDESDYQEAAVINIIEGVFSGTKYEGKGAEVWEQIKVTENTADDETRVPGIFKAIAKEVHEQYGDELEDLPDLAEAGAYEISEWLTTSLSHPGQTIQHEGAYNVEQDPPGPSVEALNEIQNNFDSQAEHATIGWDIDENLSFWGNMSIELDEHPLSQWSEKVQDEYDTWNGTANKKIEELASEALVQNDIYVDDIEVTWQATWNRETGSYVDEKHLEIQIRFDVDYDEDNNVSGFESFADRVLAYDQNYQAAKDDLLNSLVQNLLLKSEAYEQAADIQQNLARDLKNFDEVSLDEGEINAYGDLHVQVPPLPKFFFELGKKIGTVSKPGELGPELSADAREALMGWARPNTQSVIGFYHNKAKLEIGNREVQAHFKSAVGKLFNEAHAAAEELEKRQLKLDLKEAKNLYQEGDFSYGVLMKSLVYHPDSGKMTVHFYVEIPLRDETIATNIQFLKAIDRLWSTVEAAYEGVVRNHLEKIFADWVAAAEEKMKAFTPEARERRAQDLEIVSSVMQEHFEGWRNFLVD